MTVEWVKYAQSLTDRPVKGMLTGPVTMLMWSFVRDDQPRSETCKQLALAIRDEVADLEAADVKIIQVDEPAIREGLPLRSDRWDEYLDWAVVRFRLSTCSVRDETQIQTHMCYSEFGDIMEQIQEMDADVLLIRPRARGWSCSRTGSSAATRTRSRPGLYDIHSPRVPSTEEMAELLRLAARGAASPSSSGSTPTAASRRAATKRSSRRCATWSQAARQLREELVPAGR